MKRYTNGPQRVLKSGYSDLGVILPIGVVHIILTDITLGTKWLVTWSTEVATSDGFGHISISDNLALARREGAAEYAPGEGPKFKADGQYTLIIDNGRLGALYQPYPIGVQSSSSQQPYAKMSYDHIPRLLYLKPGSPVEFAWTPEAAE